MCIIDIDILSHKKQTTPRMLRVVIPTQTKDYSEFAMRYYASDLPSASVPASGRAAGPTPARAPAPGPPSLPAPILDLSRSSRGPTGPTKAISLASSPPLPPDRPAAVIGSSKISLRRIPCIPGIPDTIDPTPAALYGRKR
eukprot:329187-Amorphochlora_amoeboformis.AAC.3